jgi:DNA-binding NarL/FixJ family response regulator
VSQSAESTGYLLKDRIADVESFIEAVQRVAGGGSALDPEVVTLLLGRRRREDPLAALTPREREVLGLMAQGRSNSAMANAFVVTERAVEKHVTAIFSKLDLSPAGADHRRVLAVLRVPAGGLEAPAVAAETAHQRLRSLPRVYGR